MANAIQKRNDEFRPQCSNANPNGAVNASPHEALMLLTCGQRKRQLRQSKNFSDFTEDNDPHREHDFGEDRA